MPDATLADALSTALFGMGPDRAIELVDSLQDVEVVIIDKSGTMRLSNDIASRITCTP